LVGVGYHFQELDALAPQAWDVPLDFIATERELIACTPAAPA
jgi:5-formyltetrahydrofolate cyclo-ligase